MRATAEDLKDFDKNGVLHTGILFDIVCPIQGQGKYESIVNRASAAYDRLSALVKRFDMEVWLSGFGKDYMDRPERGYEAPFGGTTVMVFSLAGRVMLTFNLKSGSEFTLITDDSLTVSRMGVQSLHVTEEEMARELTDIIEAFQSGGVGIQHNPDIGIG